MEYNLLQTFESNYGFVSPYQDIFSEDQIIPGMGQILDFNSLIVPVHNFEDLTKIEKQNDFDAVLIDQSGAGKDTSSNETDVEIAHEKNTVKNSDLAESDLNLNEQNKKRMDPEIYESFLHPKKFKTKTVVLVNTPKQKQKVALEKQKEKQTVSSTKVKHKFSLY
jgi:hypothetical protein